MDTWVATHTFLDKQHKSMDTEVAVVFGFYLLTSTSGSSSIILYTSSVLRFLRLTLSLPRPPFLAGPNSIKFNL